jgi:hypothetical protein
LERNRHDRDDALAGAAMERLRVQSSAIRSVGYDAESRTLELEFPNGRVYQYANVPRSAYDWLLKVRAKGVFIARLLGAYE